MFSSQQRTHETTQRKFQLKTQGLKTEAEKQELKK